VSNNELTELLVWAYKQGFLDATQVLTDSVKSLDDAKIRLQLLAGLESLSTPALQRNPKRRAASDPASTSHPDYHWNPGGVCLLRYVRCGWRCPGDQLHAGAAAPATKAGHQE
jgi:hypothetical protein